MIAVDGGEVLLIDESYNANPASMAATLKSLGAERTSTRRIAVLGPMRELGEHSAALHAGLAPAIVRAHVDRLILIGDEMRPLAEALVGSIAARPRRRRRRGDASAASHAPSGRRRAGQGVQFGRAGEARREHGKGAGMLYVIAEQLGFPGVLNLIRYISFRAGAASATALLIGLLLGPKFISWLRARRRARASRSAADGPQSHLAKRGTPTMGGLLILTSVIDLGPAVDGPREPLRLGLPAGHRAASALIGWLDDYDKVKKAHHAGLSGKTRLALEFLIAGIATWLMVRTGGTGLHVPFVKETVIDLGCRSTSLSAPS